MVRPLIRVDYSQIELAPDGTDDVLHKGQLFTGLLCERGRCGAFVALMGYLGGRRHGPDRQWYPNGILMTEGYNFGDSTHGPLRHWYPSGRRMTDEFYELSICVRRHCWDESGRLIESFMLQPSDASYQQLLQRRAAFGSVPLYDLNDDETAFVERAFFDPGPLE